MKKKIAVVLCGSGYKDGSEIRESVGALWALSRHESTIDVQCFAPDAPQRDVVNCLTGQPAAGESRNQRVEAARIARAEVKPLSELRPADFAAIVVPGGFGVAKNLCDFALKGSQGTVRPEMQAALQGFHAAGKPIGAICIAPALVALAFPKESFQLTLGASGEAAQEIEKLGHRHVARRVDEICVDEKNRIVTTPAYMDDRAPIHAVFTGISKLVDQIVAWV